MLCVGVTEMDGSSLLCFRRGIAGEREMVVSEKYTTASDVVSRAVRETFS